MSDQEHHLRTLIQTLERDNADLRAKLARLDGLTNWVCSCGGTDCKGQEENAALRNEVDEQARLNGKGAERELALRAKVEMLERGNTALRADKERLDWLQNATYWPHPSLGEDLRAAIDAARKEKP